MHSKRSNNDEMDEMGLPEWVTVCGQTVKRLWCSQSNSYEKDPVV